jgi:hypothetical protein
LTCSSGKSSLSFSLTYYPRRFANNFTFFWETNRYYPETASYKYFVNVPILMQWMMGAMKALMSKDSIQKMTWMTYGSELHKYLGPDVAGEYGGEGPALVEVAKTPKYAGGEGGEKVREEGGEGVVAPATATATTAAAPAPATAV